MGNKLKQEAQTLVSWHVKAQGVKKAPKPCDISITWYEPNKRRDKDNIVSGKKYILDSLVDCGVMENDGWANINEFRDKIFLDKDNPRIEIEIYDVEG